MDKSHGGDYEKGNDWDHVTEASMVEVPINFWPCTFLFPSVIFLLLCLLPSAVPGHLVLRPIGACCVGGHTRSSDSTGVLV